MGWAILASLSFPNPVCGSGSGCTATEERCLRCLVLVECVVQDVGKNNCRIASEKGVSGGAGGLCAKICEIHDSHIETPKKNI